MTFRKDSILFIEHLCGFSIMAIISIVLLLASQDWRMALLALCFVLFAALMPVIHNEYVTVNNEGIRCAKKGKVMWEYAWDDIIKLKRSSRYRLPSVEIIIDDHANEIVPYDHSIHYFQLGRTARKAIDQYYKTKL